MANQKFTGELITVHGRGSLEFDLRVNYTVGGVKQQYDLSTRTIAFEVDGVPIRKLLVTSPSDPKAQRLVLERSLVEQLAKVPTKFSIVDETNLASGRPRVLLDGKINRDGYIGAPDAVDDA